VKIKVSRRADAAPADGRQKPVALLVVSGERERRHVVSRLEETMERTKALIHTPTGWDAAVAAIGTLPNQSGVACDLAIDAVGPQALLFVDSAASLAGQDDGDVFIGFEIAVWNRATTGAARRRIAQRSSPAVLRAATQTRDAREWKGHELVAAAKPDAVFGRLVAGDEVVALWREQGAEAVIREFPGALAIEPHGWDFLREVYGNDELPALVVAGLWTPTDDDGADDEARLVGIDHALAFALDILERLPPERTLDPLDLLADDGEWAHAGVEAEAISPALTGGFLQRPYTRSALGTQAQDGPTLNADRKDGFREDEVAALLEAERLGKVVVPPPDPPDLTIRIDLLEQGDGLRFELNSEKLNYHYLQAGQTPFMASPEKYRQDIRDSVRRIAADGGSADDLKELGWRLYRDLFPEEFKRRYSDFRDEIRTLQITSAEPWIPWELVWPYADTWQDDEPLCMRYAMTRWLRGPQPRNAFKVDSIVLIEAAAVEDEDPLDSAREECNHLSTIAQRWAVLMVSPAAVNRAAVRELVRRTKEEQAKLWHVAAHGRLDKDPMESYVVLHGRERWRASEMLGPNAQWIKLVRPFVFFNTCVVAEMSLALTGLAGWPKMWIDECQCGAFLGPRWSVESKLARAFAERFYDALVDDGLTLGEAVREARVAVRDQAPGDPTWAAYTLYGHPNARVRFGGSVGNGR
jgi:nucleoside phosphorylase